MIVSWNWLKEYVALPSSADELADRLAMSGLNHESTTAREGDLAIDLEVTSNRPDCLGHLGVAREIAVLWDRPLTVPDPQPKETGPAVDSLTRVQIELPEACPRYTARIIQGIQVGSSPSWLTDRLQTLGLAVVNNVVDVTNYVMMECGQPLHAFDLAKLNGPEIVVRAPRTKELLTAIDHRKYELDTHMCVIADAERPVALGGVMGGAETEVSEQTVDLLIEAAVFDPVSIRNTARKLNLHSPSSHRFERILDPEGVDWASRRCCELILETAGGALAKGVIDVGDESQPRPRISLRLSQVERILGIEIPRDRIQAILEKLGATQVKGNKNELSLSPPSWRSDWEREIDLIEEIARIHGYEEIPEDVRVPMAVSQPRTIDFVLNSIRNVLTAMSFDEAVTASVVPEAWSGAFDGWSQVPALQTQTPMLRGADRLRQSLLPSLLDARRHNESLGNFDADFFETAAIYLPQDSADLPIQQRTLGVLTCGSFERVKGVIEAILKSLRISSTLRSRDVEVSLFEPGRAMGLLLDEMPLGFIGEVSATTLKEFGLRDHVAMAEISLDALEPLAQLVPCYEAASPYPSIRRDLNLITDESVRWADLEQTVRDSAGQWLESLEFQEVYRDAKRDGSDKKRLLFSMTFRSHERTLTGEEVDQVRDQVIDACGKRHSTALLAS